MLPLRNLLGARQYLTRNEADSCRRGRAQFETRFGDKLERCVPLILSLSFQTSDLGNHRFGLDASLLTCRPSPWRPGRHDRDLSC